MSVKDMVKTFDYYGLDGNSNLFEERYQRNIYFLANDLLKNRSNLIKILIAIRRGSFQSPLVNISRIQQCPLITMNGIKIKKIIQEIKAIGKVNPDLAFLNVYKVKRNEFFELTQFAKEILRNLIGELKNKYYRKEKRKSGGFEHVYMVSRVVKKLTEMSWEVFSKEESFFFEKSFVYFDIMGLKQELNENHVEIFECETGANLSDQDFKKQVLKNISKCLNLGKISGFKANIIAWNLDVYQKIVKMIQDDFLSSHQGLIKLITLKNFIEGKDWTEFGEKEVDINLTENEKRLIREQMENRINKYFINKRKIHSNVGYIKLIDDKIDDALVSARLDPEDAYKIFYQLLNSLKLQDELFQGKIEEIKYYINMIKMENRILFSSACFFEAQKMGFVTKKEDLSKLTLVSPLDTNINSLHFHDFLMKHCNEKEFIVKNIQVGLKKQRFKILLLNEIATINKWGPLSPKTFVSFFVVVPKKMAITNLVLLKEYIEHIDQVELFSINQLENKIESLKMDVQNLIPEPPSY